MTGASQKDSARVSAKHRAALCMSVGRKLKAEPNLDLPTVSGAGQRADAATG